MRITPKSLLRATLTLLWGAVISGSLVSAAFGSPEPARWSALSDTLFTHHTDPEAGSGTVIIQDPTGYIWLEIGRAHV